MLPKRFWRGDIDLFALEPSSPIDGAFPKSIQSYGRNIQIDKQRFRI